MGRCYEFGVAIAPACEHAMRVVDSGGRCECETCGALCSGRFNACALIVSMPGYVPASAPTTFPVVEPMAEAEVAPEPAFLPETDPAPELVPEPERHWREVRAEIAQLRAILDEALDAMTARAPTAVSHAQLLRLRRRLAALGRAGQSVPPS